MPQKVILDVDPGRDDAVALMIAALHPDIELLGVTVTHGNRPLTQTLENCLRVLDWIGAPVPVYAGASQPLLAFIDPARRDPAAIYRLVERIEGEMLDLPAATSQPQAQHAVAWLIETLMASDGDIVLVPVGPMTNIALAIRQEPRIVGKIREVIFMGGAVFSGNITPEAEFNIWMDPEAARIVLNAGIRKVTMVPLDATFAGYVTRADCEGLIALGTPAGIAAGQLTLHRIEGAEMGVPDAAPIHDALAMCAVLDPHVLQDVRPCVLDVNAGGGKSDGRTIADLRPGVWGERAPTAYVALGADRQRFAAMLREILARRA